MRETYCLALGKPQNKGLDMLQHIDEQRTLRNKIKTFSKFQNISLKISDVTGRSGRGYACSTLWDRNCMSVLTPRVAVCGPGSSAADCPQLQEFSRSIDSTAVSPHSPSSSLSLVLLLFIPCCIISAEFCSIRVGRKTPVTHHLWMTPSYVNSEAGFVNATTPVFLDQL